MNIKDNIKNKQKSIKDTLIRAVGGILAAGTILGACAGCSSKKSNPDETKPTESTTELETQPPVNIAEMSEGEYAYYYFSEFMKRYYFRENAAQEYGINMNTYDFSKNYFELVEGNFFTNNKGEIAFFLDCAGRPMFGVIHDYHNVAIINCKTYYDNPNKSPDGFIKPFEEEIIIPYDSANTFAEILGEENVNFKFTPDSIKNMTPEQAQGFIDMLNDTAEFFSINMDKYYRNLLEQNSEDTSN